METEKIFLIEKQCHQRAVWKQQHSDSWPHGGALQPYGDNKLPEVFVQNISPTADHFILQIHKMVKTM